MSELVLTARAVLPRPGAAIPGGGLLVAGDRIERVLGSPRAVARARNRPGARLRDLGEVLLAPGLVNAHAHLELTGLGGRIPPGADFGAWIGAVLRLRAERGPSRLAGDAAEGARRLLWAGATAVGDVDTTGAAERGLARARLRTVLFRELLDAQDPARTGEALARVRRALPPRALRREGLAPHAPFTASPALLAAIAVLARRRRAPLSVHWSETEDELCYLERGEGPLAERLGPSPRRSGLELLEDAGLLGPGLALVHGNHPGRGEIARIAAAGATLVHCPGTHAFFGREPAPLRHYLRAGVPVALGTDSLASNRALDPRHEMRAVGRAHPWLTPEAIWAMGTVHGARALGLAGEVGELVPGARADLVALGPLPCPLGSGTARALVEAAIEGLSVVGVWVGGRPVRPVAAAFRRGSPPAGSPEAGPRAPGA